MQGNILLFTWINHSSFLQLIKAGIDLQRFNVIGIDGIYLNSLLNRPSSLRTSADLVLPHIFSSTTGTVILVGGYAHDLNVKKTEFEKLFPNMKVESVIEGFGDVVGAILENTSRRMPDFIVLGMGAPMQELVAIELKDRLIADTRVSIFTCGGWLDQILIQNYYPSWAYRLKLNWLVRLSREPSRLWRRYTLEPISILFQIESLRRLRKLRNLY